MLYNLLRIICWPFLKLFFLYKVKNNPKNINNQKLIICANHKSLLDPILLVQINPGKVHFMAKKELFKNKFLARILSSLGAFPVDRGHNDIDAVRQSIKILNENKILGIFPEGTRVRDEDVSREKYNDGVAMISLKTNANILPVSIKGKYGLFSRPTFEYKDIIDISKFNNSNKKELYREIMDEVYSSIIEN